MNTSIKLFIKISLLFLMNINSFSQSKVFPSKYDRQPNIKLISNENYFDHGILYDIQGDTIIIQSFTDMRLYGYITDSISRLEYKKGFGFYKIGTPVFITLSTFLIGIDIITGVEMVPLSSLLIPIGALPVALIAGGTSALLSQSHEFDFKTEDFQNEREKLLKHKLNQDSKELNFNIRLLSETGLQLKTNNSSFPKIEVFTEVNHKFNSFGNQIESYLEGFEYKNLSYQRKHMNPFAVGLSLNLKNKVKIGYAINIGDLFYGSNMIYSMDILVPGSPDVYMLAKIYKETMFRHFLTVDYSVLGNNYQNDKTMVQVGFGIFYSYSSINTMFYQYDSGYPYGIYEGYNDGWHSKLGGEISTSIVQPISNKTSVAIKAYIGYAPSIELSGNTFTNPNNNETVSFDSHEFRFIEYGIRSQFYFRFN